MNAQDLIASSMRLIGALASGETPTGAEASDALLVLNQMLDSWNAERLMIFTISIAEYPLVVGQQTYTLGTGGNFNAARPAKIERMSIVSLMNPAQPLELPMQYFTTKDWQEQIPVKLINSTLPLVVYDDGAFPLRNLNFWPIPTINVNTRIYSWTALSSFANLTTDLTFPPGYLEALRYNLAARLMAEMPGDFNQITGALVPKLAMDALARIRDMNTVEIQLRCDEALIGTGGRYDYRSDQPVWGRG